MVSLPTSSEPSSPLHKCSATFSVIVSRRLLCAASFRWRAFRFPTTRGIEPFPSRSARFKGLSRDSEIQSITLRSSRRPLAPPLCRFAVNSRLPSSDGNSCVSTSSSLHTLFRDRGGSSRHGRRARESWARERGARRGTESRREGLSRCDVACKARRREELMDPAGC